MRPEGWSKLGYYPTPPTVTETIAQRLDIHCSDPESDLPPEPGYTMLDPCAGEGIALAQIAQAVTNQLALTCQHPHPVVTHGIEPEIQRAARAAERLTAVHRANIETVTLPEAAYDLLFLNPPYDWDTEHRDAGIRRLESFFLEVCTPALKPGGILVYIIPQHAYAHDANRLAINYTDVQIGRFPDPEYDEFKQSVLIGRRRPELNDAFQHTPAIERALRRHATVDGVNAKTWPPRRPKHYYHCARHEIRPAPEISAPAANSDRLSLELARASAWHSQTLRQELAASPERRRIRPLEPLRRGHICVLAANGQLNNIPLHDPTGAQDPVVIKGSADKITETVSETADLIKKRESFQARLAYLNLVSGEVTEITESADEIGKFFNQWQDSIAAAVTRRFPPRVDPTAPEHQEIRQRISTMRRGLLGKQAPSAIATAVALQQDGHAIIAAQQGSGKTILAIAAATGSSFSRMLVVTPPHNVPTWADEIKATTPNARVRVVKGIGNPNYPDRSTFNKDYAVCDLETIRQTPADPERPVWAILKRDSAKMTYPYEAPARVIGPVAPNERGFKPVLYRHDGKVRKPKDGHENRADTCPHCWVAYKAYENHDWHSRNSRCANCDHFLAGPAVQRPGDRRYPWADYISKRMPDWADLFIADEVHQFKSKRSAQGDVFRRLAQASKRTLALTGTIIGGKAQEAFYLLTAFAPEFHQSYGYHQLGDFNRIYGRVETTYARNDYGANDYGANDYRNGARSSVRTGRKLAVKVLNGFHPSMLDHFWANTVFTRIHDIKRDLKHPDIRASLVELDETPIRDADGRATSQAAAYERLDEELRSHLKGYIKRGDLRPAAQMLQSLLTYPENCWQGDTPIDPETGDPIIVMRPLPEDRLYPKEEALIALLHEQKSRGRKTLVYCTHTQRRNVTDRLQRLLNQAGLKTGIMKAGADGRLKWLRQAAHRYDAVICQPRAVETGLNLLEYPTICWYEIDYSMYTVEQASARSHRINQEQQVEIHYLAYAGTIQEDALRTIAAKADTARMIYGELSATGLSAFNPDDADLRTIVARQMYREAQGAESREIDAGSERALEQLQADREINRLFQLSRERREAAADRAADTLADIDYSDLVNAVAPAVINRNGHSNGRPRLPSRQYSNKGAQQLTLLGA